MWQSIPGGMSVVGTWQLCIVGTGALLRELLSMDGNCSGPCVGTDSSGSANSVVDI